MDGGSGQPVAWRSSIPGVSQRDGAPASLALAGRGVRASSFGEAGERGEWGQVGGSSLGPAGDGRSVSRRGRRVVPWRAMGMAVVAIVAIVGVARAAGVDAGGSSGDGGGTSSAGWETLGSGAGSAVGSDAGSAPGVGVGSAPTPDSAAPSSAGSPTPEGPAPAVAPGDESPDWRTVLAELDARRVLTLTQVDPALLATYAQVGSTAWKEDAALLADLSARGLRPQGLASKVLAVETVDHDGAQARLQVVDERAGYSMIDANGAVVQQVESAGPRRWTVTLSRLAPPGAGLEAADPGGVPEGSGPPERRADVAGGAEPSLTDGRDPGWRVASVVPVLSGESTGIDHHTTLSAVDDPKGAP